VAVLVGVDVAELVREAVGVDDDVAVGVSVVVLVDEAVLVGVEEGVTVLVGEAVGVDEDVAVGSGSTTRTVSDAPGTSRIPKVTVPTFASATVADAPGWSDPDDHV
jgi:hypothetical protein